MAMEFTKCIGELLRKNGVVPKLTEYTRNFETDNTFETRYGVSIDELDFSEHDKVFEDKIAKLEDKLLKLIKTAEQHQDARMVYERECEELKQRIAEFESEKSGKQGKSGRFVVVKEINGQEYVKVEDFMSVVNDLKAEIGN